MVKIRYFNFIIKKAYKLAKRIKMLMKILKFKYKNKMKIKIEIST